MRCSCSPRCEDGAEGKLSGYAAGLIVLGVAFLAEGISLARALHQVHRQGGASAGARDPALRTVVAEDGTAVLGVTLAMIGMALHMITGQVVWEASASLGIGGLLVYAAYRLGREAMGQLIGEASDPEDSDLVAARIKRSIARTVPEAGEIFLDVSDRHANEARESPAATGERGGA